ncbi:MAG: hypothetical protein WCA06_07755, partial [Terrimicrobiaceae bacterium]
FSHNGAAMNQRDREIEVARMLKRRGAVLERLQALPNVRSVGVGMRVRRGKLTGELAFGVYVDVKVPRAKLVAADLIPEIVEGIRTDVLQIGRARKLCWSKGTRPLVGGVEISDSPVDTFSMKSGTLGCIVTTADGKMAALSNEHVLRHKMHSDRHVYQPFYDDCLGFQCNKIGESIAGLENHFEHEVTSFWIDCAIAILDSGIGRGFRLRRVIHKTLELIEVAMPAGVEGKVWINQDGKVVAIRDRREI